MKQRYLSFIVLGIIFWGILLFITIPRRVPFMLIVEFNKPTVQFDASSFIGFEVVDNEDRLFYWLTKRLPEEYAVGYDSLFVSRISKELEYDEYEYIITYQKRLTKLRHSPLFTLLKDDLYYDKRTPLIPIWDNKPTDSIYIYQIVKNRKFRSPGP